MSGSEATEWTRRTKKKVNIESGFSFFMSVLESMMKRVRSTVGAAVLAAAISFSPLPCSSAQGAERDPAGQEQQKETARPEPTKGVYVDFHLKAHAGLQSGLVQGSNFPEEFREGYWMEEGPWKQGMDLQPDKTLGGTTNVFHRDNRFIFPIPIPVTLEASVGYQTPEWVFDLGIRTYIDHAADVAGYVEPDRDYADTYGIGVQYHGKRLRSLGEIPSYVRDASGLFFRASLVQSRSFKEQENSDPAVAQKTLFLEYSLDKVDFYSFKGNKDNKSVGQGDQSRGRWHWYERKPLGELFIHSLRLGQRFQGVDPSFLGISVFFEYYGGISFAHQHSMNDLGEELDTSFPISFEIGYNGAFGFSSMR